MSELEDLRDKFRKMANGHNNDFARWASIIDRQLAWRTKIPAVELSDASLDTIARAKERVSSVTGVCISVDPELTGHALWDLIVAIEGAIGARRAGCTPLGRAVTDLCEAARKRDPVARER